MNATLLAQAAALASAAGVSTYATVALIGFAGRQQWFGALPEGLHGLTSWWVIGLAATLYAVEFLATLVPGVASAWETVHSAIRPLAGAALAAATAWQADPAVVAMAGLLGGTLALGTHATKLGARVAIDASPEPVTNGVANLAEAGFVATVGLLVWQHPWVALGVTVVVVVLLALLVRALWRGLGRAFRRMTGGEATR
ncbi:DUF4126 domain-containing protein [Roseisolibacter sp. H3M3-2]|uniref:DUF4126 domain-containing protein n=1 Tax=Roseisolibacter sp. H3M3-2 TaxID=3031323 RepID=UPI0023DB6B9E|nr:DUF4126 domain-containing protein [Roseisolibacter sp. H3M3-2]MDF1503215.1 DUF4126 domain-containing protein [Roseisolibacter sp. H3M3-2]